MHLSSRRTRWALVLLALTVVAVLLWLALRRADAPASVATRAVATVAAGPQFFDQLANAPALLPAAARAQRRQQLLEHIELTDHTYCSYREGSQYPASSRPMSQNPDQAYPNLPVTEMNAMRLGGRNTNPDVLIQTTQSRVYLAAGETVSFALRAQAPNGNPVPLQVTRAVATGMAANGTRAAATVALTFADDASAGARALWNPAQSSLASFDGTIRTEVRYSAAGKSGVVNFDVIHTPTVPAVWVGAPREALEDGSLSFILRADVRQPGRYIITGRIDDARGRPFALATFNEPLGPGAHDIRLQAFGKLMHDGGAQLPLTLRDVDGYLLKENTDPDRALMPRLEGPVLTSRTRNLDGVANAEWDSEERTRHLTEFAKDRLQARSELQRFDPAATLPASGCVSP